MPIIQAFKEGFDVDAFGVRSYNGLRRGKIANWAFLGLASPKDSMAISQMGQKSVYEIIKVVLYRAVLLTIFGVPPSQQEGSQGQREVEELMPTGMVADPLTGRGDGEGADASDLPPPRNGNASAKARAELCYGPLGSMVPQAAGSH